MVSVRFPSSDPTSLSRANPPSRLPSSFSRCFKDKANLHRVVFPSTSESNGFPGRRSIAFFSQPRLEVVLNPVGAGGSIAETPGALTSEQFFLERMQAAAAY